MATSLQASLSSLTEREGVADALYRMVESFDNNDFDLLKSASVSDISVDLNGTVFDNLEAIRTQLLAGVGPMDTFHAVSNVRVDLKEGNKTASATAYVLAQHCPPGRGNEPDGPKFLAASRYFVDLVKDKDDGLWKIGGLKLKIIWTQGDRSVMPGRG